MSNNIIFKNKIIKLFLIIMLLTSLCTLTGCKFFSKEATKTKTILIDFLGYLKEDNIEEASKLFHPDSSMPETLNSILSVLENQNNISFNDEIVIGECIDFEITAYNGQYKGKTCKLVFNATTNNKTIEIYIFTVDNKNGYGIYDFSIHK